MADRPMTRDMRRQVPNMVPRTCSGEQGVAAPPGALARALACLFARC
jgi:hypothetical protein